MLLLCYCFRGPQDTCFEGGVFPAVLSFPSDYPLSPPKMKFTCDMFHPNSEFAHHTNTHTSGRWILSGPDPHQLTTSSQSCPIHCEGLQVVLVLTLKVSVPLQFTQMVGFASPSFTLLETIQWAMRAARSGGVQSRVWRRSCFRWSAC